MLNADEIVVQLVDVADALFLDEIKVLVLEVEVWNELTVGDVVFRFLLVFENLAREHVKAVHFSHLVLGLSHADLVYLSAKCFSSFGQHLEEVASEKYLPIIGVAQFVDPEGNLSISTEI